MGGTASRPIAIFPSTQIHSLSCGRIGLPTDSGDRLTRIPESARQIHQIEFGDTDMASAHDAAVGLFPRVEFDVGDVVAKSIASALEPRAVGGTAVVRRRQLAVVGRHIGQVDIPGDGSAEEFRIHDQVLEDGREQFSGLTLKSLPFIVGQAPTPDIGVEDILFQKLRQRYRRDTRDIGFEAGADGAGGEYEADAGVDSHVDPTNRL